MFLVGRLGRGHCPVGRIASCTIFVRQNDEKREEERRSRTSAGTADGETWQGKPADSRGLPSSAAGPTARSPAPYTSSRTPPPVTALSNSAGRTAFGSPSSPLLAAGVCSPCLC